jgi:hypothetical protein
VTFVYHISILTTSLTKVKSHDQLFAIANEKAGRVALLLFFELSSHLHFYADGVLHGLHFL